MITPRSPLGSGVFCAIAAAASRMTLNVPTRLTRIVFSNRSSGCGPFFPSTFAAGPMPAALTTPCSPPKALTREIDRAPDLLFARDVGLREARVGAERLFRRHAGLGVHVENDDAPAGGDHRFRRRAPEARCAAGDDETLCPESA